MRFPTKIFVEVAFVVVPLIVVNADMVDDPYINIPVVEVAGERTSVVGLYTHVVVANPPVPASTILLPSTYDPAPQVTVPLQVMVPVASFPNVLTPVK